MPRNCAMLKAVPDTRLIGCSSCGGILTQDGHHGRHGWSLSVAALYDDKGAYGVAGQMGDQPDVRQLLRRAIADGGRPASCRNSSCCTPARGWRRLCSRASTPSLARRFPSSAGRRQTTAWRVAAVLG
jgi:hypothetical protein